MNRRVRLILLVGMVFLSALTLEQAVASSAVKRVKPLNTKKWMKYDVGRIRFHDKAPQSEGSKMYKL